MSPTAAARQLGVDVALIRAAIQNGALQFDPQPDRNGRPMKVLRRSDIAALKAKMGSQTASL
jgi:hypothetical protein